MDNDKRSGEQVITDELREALNPQQRTALGELELLGWSLKFVRRPLFQDPVPVVVSDSSNTIGILDSDGKIVVDRENIRAEGNAAATLPGRARKAGTATGPAGGANLVEKRTGEAPVPDNLEEYLNSEQLHALRQIENFGWALKFVRRPLFQDPVAIIMNGSGDKIGVLGADGRIDLQQSIEAREVSAGPDGNRAASPVSGKKQSG